MPSQPNIRGITAFAHLRQSETEGSSVPAAPLCLDCVASADCTRVFRAERFVGKSPRPPILPEAVWINPPAKKTTLQDAPGSMIVAPDGVLVPPDPAIPALPIPESGIFEVAH